MKARILAENDNDAKQKLFEKIKFHKIELEKKEEFNEIMDIMDGFVDTLKGMGKK